jgi:hypothetical protein
MTSLNKIFPAVFNQSKFISEDHIIKIEYQDSGRHIIFGRTIDNNNYSNLMLLGKIIEQTPGKNYFSSNAWLDTTFPHVIYITGTRGSGKSFDLGVLLEGISTLNEESNVQNFVEPITSVLIDTQSQFWTLKYPPNKNIPENKDQLDELKKWNLQPNSLSRCKIFIPRNTERITGDETFFTIKPSQLTHGEWCALMNQEVYSPQGHILGNTLEHFEGNNFSIEQMRNFIQDDSNFSTISDQSRNVLLYKLDDYRRTNLFSNDGLDIADLLVKGQSNVFMLRDLRNEDISLVTSIIARQLFSVMGSYHRRRRVDAFFDRNPENQNLPSKVWLLIDEAHVVAPANAPSPARSSLTEYVKRGRDAGLSLVIATQQPSAVDDKILSQINLSLGHRLTFENDVNAASDRVPTGKLKSVKTSGLKVDGFGNILRLLGPGECFIGDQNTSRSVIARVRPRVTSHGGYNPK